MSEVPDIREPLGCIVCGKEPGSAFGDTEDDRTHRQPYGATTFVSHGHYGSTVFDDIDSGAFLEINVCDDCLVKATERNVLLGRPIYKAPEVVYERWDGTHV